MEVRAQWKMSSPIGNLFIVASQANLQGVFWDQQPVKLISSLEGEAPEVKLVSKTVQQLEEYFQGERTEFDLPLEAKGTVFQDRVWKELEKIPYGETCSYQDIAVRLNQPKACRAVGSANSKNPLSIIVPCHRVVTAQGTIGGYAGGQETKQKLLDLEKKFREKRA